MACRSMGGSWISATTVYPGGTMVAAHCEIDDGGTDQDGAPISDAGTDGG